MPPAPEKWFFVSPGVGRGAPSANFRVCSLPPESGAGLPHETLVLGDAAPAPIPALLAGPSAPPHA